VNGFLRGYIVTPYYSRLETLGVSLAVGLFSRSPSVFSAAIAFGVLIVMALIVAATKTLWGNE
jgi:hypothetical protein